MPILHTVLFKLAGEATPDQLQAAKASVVAFSEIPGCSWARFGDVFPSERARGYTHQFIGEFENLEALQIFATHPIHLEAIATHVRPLFD
ncbi:hypothetical protein HK100_006949, partial [Physocladia obscura]